MIETLPDAFIFMKVGSHAGETWEQIVERKNREFQETGRIFWGYGGSACHPLTQVQPFVRMHIKQKGSIYLVMQSILSNADPDVVPATEYSEDGANWRPLPQGTKVTGSRHAIVLDEIKPTNIELNSQDFVVGVGASRGKRADQYLRARTDKACLVRSEEREQDTEEGDDSKRLKLVSFAAKLKEPYAVMLR